ncbi:MAG: HIT domain-containing protein [Caldilineaceae bacterium]|nr:HIT domain-containing protein [Caldilineaceae bacterium]MCB0141996.1 HIT domain-containing protein [Caldilineaceae bacterium]
MNACHTCTLTARRDAGAAPLWDNIYRTAHWDVVHSFNTSLPGWLVLVARRHMAAVAELTAAEAAELGDLQRRVSRALHEVTGCAKTYIIQFAEHPDHPHVHFHIVPRMAGQPAERRSVNIFSCLGVAETERVSEEEMNEVGAQIRKFLQN